MSAPTPDAVAERVKELKAAGGSVRKIAAATGLALATVQRIVGSDPNARRPERAPTRTRAKPSTRKRAARPGRKATTPAERQVERATKTIATVAATAVERGELAQDQRRVAQKATLALEAKIDAGTVGPFHLIGAATYLAKSAELLDGRATERVEAPQDREAEAEALVDALERSGAKVIVVDAKRDGGGGDS